MYIWNDAWLTGTAEDVLEPELAIIDPHHHLWEREGMTRYLADDLLADTGGGHNVEATVFVECMWGYRNDGPLELRPVGETETVAAVAERNAGRGSEILGIVGFADMTRGDAVDDVLEAHIAAGRGRFRGIRHATAFDPSPDVRRTHTNPPAQLMAHDSFRAAVKRLAHHGLSFDAWLYHPQITDLAALARAVPECMFVLDHLGGMLGIGPYAGRRDEILAQWRIDLADLATCANVVLKVGGIGMTVFGLGFEAGERPPTSDDLVSAWGGPMQYTIETFGVDRCMFESNFPVDKMSCSYNVLWNAFKKVAAGASAPDKAALFHDTTQHVYRL